MVKVRFMVRLEIGSATGMETGWVWGYSMDLQPAAVQAVPEAALYAMGAESSARG